MKLIVVFTLLVAFGPAAPTWSAEGSLSPEDAVKKWVEEAEGAYARGDIKLFEERMDPDGLFVGSDPQEVWETPRFLKVHRAMLAGVAAGKMKWRLTHRDLRTGASPDGRAVWMSDLGNWDFGGGQSPMPFRWTAVFVARGGQWLMSASHFSIGLPNEEAQKLFADGKLPSLGEIPDKVDPAAKPVLAVFDRDLASMEQWAKDTSDRDDVYAIGSDPTEIKEGGKTFQQWLRGHSGHAIRQGAARARVSEGGQLGWVTANIGVDIEDGKGKKAPCPFRALAVYLRENGDWKMVQLHVSNGIPNG